MNHFRDCLFTSNKISVNILLSGFSASFTSCHFDFENCVFRTAYRTSLMVDKCHIEGTGKELKNKYFPDGFVTEDLTSSFKNRAQNDPMDEFVGIMYAKPLTKFGGGQVAQYSYVDLNITSSRIIDTYDMPWSVFSNYNSGTAQYSDGHFRSRIYLNNNKYAYANSAPISFLTTEDNGIIHSGFLLSEFPETTEVSNNANDKVRYEKFACQNIPAISRDSTAYGSFYSASEPRKNHRFLSNRTLANKYPYFQNVTYSEEDGYTGIGINIEKIGASAISLAKTGSYDNYNPFSAYVGDKANCIRFKDVYFNSENESGNVDFDQPFVSFSLNDDPIKCEQGDVISAALVTDVLAYNYIYVRDENTGENVLKEIPLNHKIHFVEVCGSEEKKYSYDAAACVGSEEYDLFDYYFPSTGVCKHIVKNKETQYVRIEFDFYIPVIESSAVDYVSHTTLCAVLVEKNM